MVSTWGLPPPASCEMREHTAQFCDGGLVAVDRHLLLVVTKHPQIIEPKDVIRMAVGIEDRINPFDLSSQRLQAEFCSCVNENIKACTSKMTELRVRLFRVELVQTLHWHPITGMPWEVPVPKKVSSTISTLPNLTRTYVLHIMGIEHLFFRAHV